MEIKLEGSAQDFAAPEADSDCGEALRAISPRSVRSLALAVARSMATLYAATTFRAIVHYECLA
jgi:hypothetical protein